MSSCAVFLEEQERPPVTSFSSNLEEVPMQKKAAVRGLLEDVQLGGLPVVSVADTERTMKKRKAGPQGQGRATLDAKEKEGLQFRYKNNFGSLLLFPSSVFLPSKSDILVKFQGAHISSHRALKLDI